MLVASVIAVLVGVCLCTAIIRAVAGRYGLPIRETLMWFGLVELEGPALARACEHREVRERREAELTSRRRPGQQAELARRPRPGREPARLSDGSYG